MLNKSCVRFQVYDWKREIRSKKRKKKNKNQIKSKNVRVFNNRNKIVLKVKVMRTVNNI